MDISQIPSSKCTSITSESNFSVFSFLVFLCLCDLLRVELFPLLFQLLFIPLEHPTTLMLLVEGSGELGTTLCN